jgi:hypothetical protein
MKAPTKENMHIAPMKFVAVVEELATPMCIVSRKYPTKFIAFAMFAAFTSTTSTARIIKRR